MMDGILIVDKPSGITSHDVVENIRHKFGIKRVGHAGTLDPIATGILILLLGKATKLFSNFVNFDKEYEATLTLGISTQTGDTQGKTIEIKSYENIALAEVEKVFNESKEQTEQIPPIFSALKYKGRRLYALARKGIEVPLIARKIKIYSLELRNFNLPEIDFYIRCSKGTYVRKVAQDMGKMLGCGGCISRIRRVGIGPFKIEEAIKLADINESHLRHWQY